MCAITGKPYTIFGYKGKQVRDQIHCRDVARLFLQFFKNPRSGEVYNLGGGRENSLSVLETVDMLALRGHTLEYRYDAQNRTGDHICYITDLQKVYAHFPNWRIEHRLPFIVSEMEEQILQSSKGVSQR